MKGERKTGIFCGECGEEQAALPHHSNGRFGHPFTPRMHFPSWEEMRIGELEQALERQHEIICEYVGEMEEINLTLVDLPGYMDHEGRIGEFLREFLGREGYYKEAEEIMSNVEEEKPLEGARFAVPGDAGYCRESIEHPNLSLVDQKIGPCDGSGLECPRCNMDEAFAQMALERMGTEDRLNEGLDDMFDIFNDLYADFKSATYYAEELEEALINTDDAERILENICLVLEGRGLIPVGCRDEEDVMEAVVESTRHAKRG